MPTSNVQFRSLHEDRDVIVMRVHARCSLFLSLSSVHFSLTSFARPGNYLFFVLSFPSFSSSPFQRNRVPHLSCESTVFFSSPFESANYLVGYSNVRYVYLSFSFFFFFFTTFLALYLSSFRQDPSIKRFFSRRSRSNR